MASKQHFKYIGFYKNRLYIRESRPGQKSQEKSIRFNNDYHSAFYEFLVDIASSTNKTAFHANENLTRSIYFPY